MTPPDPGNPASAARSARLFEACDGLPAWWRAPLRAGRNVAETMARAPVDAAQWDRAWNGFQEPFLLASAHVDALRNPASMLSAPLAGTAAAGGNAEGASPFEGRMPGAIGLKRGQEDASSGSPGRSGDGARVRSSSSAEAMPRRSGAGRSGAGSPDAGPDARSSKAILSASSAAPGPVSIPSASLRAANAAGSGSARIGTAVEAGMGAWSERTRKAIRRLAPPASVAPAGRLDAAIPAAAGTDSSEAQAWFSAWINGSASAGTSSPADFMAASGAEAGSRFAAATGGIAAKAAALRPAADVSDARTPKPSPDRRTPDWTDLLAELMPGAGTERPFRAPAERSAPDFAAPDGRRGPRDRSGIPEEETDTVRHRDDTSGPVPPIAGGTAQPQGASPMQWLGEEDDLAGRLHRLLRRQAKRRGMDLS